MLLFKPDQCNAPFHRAAQEVICGHKWEAADLGLDGHRDGWMSPTWPRGDTKAPHTPLPCIKTCLWFRVCDLPPPPRRKTGSTASDILMGGRGEPLFECGISALLWRPSQPGEMHVPRAWHSTLNLPGNKPQTHLANSDRWQGDGRATVATLWCSYSSPPALSLWFSFNEKKLESNHLNITLSQRKIIPYSLEK